MEQFKRQIAVAAVFLVLGLIGMFMSAHQVGAQNGPPNHPAGTAPVHIVSPIPLPVTGSISGVVEATQSGPWIVGITDTVNVKNIDERGRNPYFVSLHCESQNSNGCGASAPAVPAGKRLVIEQVNATIQVRSPGVIQGFDVLVGNSFRGYMPGQLVWNDGVLTNFAINETVLIFAEAGQTPQIQFSSTEIGVNATGRLSGYLVDLTQ
jgi:hypothetical protein